VIVPARGLAGVLLLLALAAQHAAAAPSADASRPNVGRHTAELCVATLPAPPSCGPAQADLRNDGSLRLRIDDVVYRMQLHSSQVEIVLMHGAVQIDEFTVPYDWAGTTLRFVDAAKNARYEVRFPDQRAGKR
jgi:hypothetical protein